MRIGILAIASGCYCGCCGRIDESMLPADASTEVRVRLQNATATFSQTGYGGFLVGAAINGSTSDNTGWGIDPKVADQIAAFETVADTPIYVSGSRITFTMQQKFSPAHALGRFRLAYTTASRDAFADGNDGSATPGNVGPPAIWTVLVPVSAVASNGAALAIRDDASVLAHVNSTDVTYTVVVDAKADRITGFRLEALQDDSLPHRGPGLQEANGNFVLTELSVSSAPL